MGEYERIYLEPEPGGSTPDAGEGRCWCADDDPAGIGEPWTPYVRADLFDVLAARLDAAERDAARLLYLSRSGLWPHIPELYAISETFGAGGCTLYQVIDEMMRLSPGDWRGVDTDALLSAAPAETGGEG